jgi:hypothetical protein
VRPRRHGDQVRKLLADGGYTLPGKDGRHVRQIMVEGFGSKKPYFACIPLSCLPVSRNRH